VVLEVSWPASSTSSRLCVISWSVSLQQASIKPASSQHQASSKTNVSELAGQPQHASMQMLQLCVAMHARKVLLIHTQQTVCKVLVHQPADLMHSNHTRYRSSDKQRPYHIYARQCSGAHLLPCSFTAATSLPRMPGTSLPAASCCRASAQPCRKKLHNSP
jgi:hypothetical protein